MVKLKVFLIIFVCIENVVQCELTVTDSKTEVDLVINNIKVQNWHDHEKECIDDMLLILNNVKNHTVWAVWIWNSMHHPSGIFYGVEYSLGNYEQCLHAPTVYIKDHIETQYCLTKVKLADEDVNDTGHYVSRKVEENLGVLGHFNNRNMFDDTKEFLKIRTRMGRKLNKLSWGTCLPVSCKVSTIPKVLEVIYKTNPITSINPEISVISCNSLKTGPKYDLKFYAFVSLVVFLITTAVASTIFTPKSSDSLVSRIITSFDMRRNWTSLTKSSNDEIPILNFTKSFHTLFTINIHAIVMQLSGIPSNALDLDKTPGIKDNIIENLLAHGDVIAIENFIVITGILQVIGLMDKKKNPFIALIQRFIRLSASFYLVTFYTVAVAKFTGNGPIWDKLMGKEVETCSKNWLYNILMLNTANTDNICVATTWYATFDFQVTIIGTVIFCIIKWNKIIGVTIAIITYLSSIFLPLITTYRNRLPGIMLHDISNMIDFRTNAVFVETYSKTVDRCGSYLLGMVMGYILCKYRPAKHRGVITKEWSYVILAAGFALAIKVVAVAPEWCLGDYNVWYSAVYAALNRHIWTIATLMCIAVNEYGDLPAIKSFISWHGFAIIGRLGYGIYLWHYPIFLRGLFIQRAPKYFDLLDCVIYITGLFVFSSIISLLLWLFVESPLSNLTNLVLIKRKNKAAKPVQNDENQELIEQKMK